MRTIAEILAALNAIVAAAEGRTFTDEEAADVAALEQELAEAQARESAQEETEQANAERDAEIRARISAYNQPRNTVPRTGNRKTKSKDEENAEINAAFNAFLRTGQPNADIAHLRVSNAQGGAAGPTGGYMVPTDFNAKLIDRMKAFGGLANVVETITTTTGAPLEWAVTLDDTANTGEIVQENAQPASGSDLAFDQVQLGAYRYATAGTGADPLRVSVDLLQDAAFDVEALVSRKLGERLGRKAAPDLVRGSGVGAPRGLITGITPVQTAANTGAVYDDFITWEHSVDPAYRELGCQWAMNDLSLAAVKKMKDSHGDPLWRPRDADMGVGTGGGFLLGYPVVIDQGFPDIDVDDSTDIWGAFGNFREAYVRRLVRSVVVIVNPWTRANFGQVEFSAWMRMDGTVQNTAAYVGISGKS